MTAREDWLPTLDADGKTLHDRLVGALRRDIAAGVLMPGTRIPTQRELALQLRIGIGTVTKFYSEATRMGLLTSHVGRGTYVAGGEAEPQRNGPIDLTLNLPPLPPCTSRLGEALGRLRDRPSLSGLAEFAPHLGFDAHRQAAVAWLTRTSRFEGADWRRLAICSGAQQAMFLAFDMLCQPGDAIMAEAVTFHGFKTIAGYRGWNLVGLEMDREGILPDALERASAMSRSKVLYVQPSLQNPTASTMSRSRREDVVRIARHYDLAIVEGDLYGPLAWRSERRDFIDASPLAVLAPERTFYVSSMSKIMATGLRTGFLVVPDAAALDRVAKAMRATCYAASAFGPQISTDWIESGVADDILDEIVGLASMRTAIVKRGLGEWLNPPSHDSTLHMWVPLPEAVAERVANEAQRKGVLLTPPSAPAIDPGTASGLRICACAPSDITTLERAITIIAGALRREPSTESQTII